MEMQQVADFQKDSSRYLNPLFPQEAFQVACYQSEDDPQEDDSALSVIQIL